MEILAVKYQRIRGNLFFYTIEAEYIYKHSISGPLTKNLVVDNGYHKIVSPMNLQQFTYSVPRFMLMDSPSYQRFF